MKITGNLQYLVLFYCLPYNTLYHLRDWLHGVKRFALSECILFPKCNSFGVISDLLNVEIKKFQSSYYSVSYELTALKIHHDTVHQEVGEQHI